MASDWHVTLVVKLCVTASKNSKPHPVKSFDWREVSSNHQISKSFSIAVHNKFEALAGQEEVNCDNMDTIYSNLISATETVATEMLPIRPKRNKNPSKCCPFVKSARENLKELSLRYHRQPTRALKKSIELAKKKLDESYLKVKADFIEGKIDKLSSLHINNKHHAAWKTIKDLKG